MRTEYSTNLTENQWQVIEKIINPQERARKHSLRDIMDSLHSLVRKLVGRNESPSMGIIDSRSVKTSHHADPSCKGIDGNKKAIERLEHKFPRLEKILADGGYWGTLADWVAQKFGWTLEVVLRPDECPSKFTVLPKRWIVERSFSWLENFRRLTIDYEFLAETTEAMVQLAFTQIMLNRFFQ